MHKLGHEVEHNLEGARDAPSLLQQLFGAQMRALDHAVGAREVLVHEEGRPQEPLRDADPGAPARARRSSYLGKSRCVRSVSTSREVAVAPFGPART